MYRPHLLILPVVGTNTYFRKKLYRAKKLTETLRMSQIGWEKRDGKLLTDSQWRTVSLSSVMRDPSTINIPSSYSVMTTSETNVAPVLENTAKSPISPLTFWKTKRPLERTHLLPLSPSLSLVVIFQQHLMSDIQDGAPFFIRSRDLARKVCCES